MTRLADTRPPYCASCFQRPQGRCVDFEAAYDGPVIPGSPNVPVDDLILCEDCLAEAFAILDPANLKETIGELTQIVLDQQKELDAKDKVIQGLRSTTTELIEHPVKSFTGKPKLEGVPPEVREKITRARYERRGTSPAPKHNRNKEAKEARERERAAV